MSLAISTATTSLKKVTTVLFSEEYTTETTLAACEVASKKKDKTFSVSTDATALVSGMIIAATVLFV